MRIVKFFLYVIFLTGLFFVAERIDALSYQETGINRSKWEKSVGNGFNNNEYGFVTSTPVNTSSSDKNSYRARFFANEPLSLKDGEYYIQIPLYFRFEIENMIYQTFDYDSGTGQFTGYFNSKETSVTFNVSLTSSTGVVGNCYFLNDGIHANPTVSCPKFNRLTDIQYITFDVYTLYSNFDTYSFRIGFNPIWLLVVDNSTSSFNTLNDTFKKSSDQAHADFQSSYNQAQNIADTARVDAHQIREETKNNTQAVKDASTQAHNDSQNEITNSNKNHNEFMNKDLTAKDKEEIDTSEYDNYSKQEEGLLDYAKQMDTDTLDISMDISSSTFIWDLFTKLINTHKAIMTLFISILSIGVIKLALGR